MDSIQRKRSTGHRRHKDLLRFVYENLKKLYVYIQIYIYIEIDMHMYTYDNYATMYNRVAIWYIIVKQQALHIWYETVWSHVKHMFNARIKLC